MWEKIKRIYASGFLFATTAWILTHLILIFLKKRVVIMEDNKLILWIEIIGTAGLLGLAIERIVGALMSL